MTEGAPHAHADADHPPRRYRRRAVLRRRRGPHLEAPRRGHGWCLLRLRGRHDARQADAAAPPPRGRRDRLRPRGRDRGPDRRRADPRRRGRHDVHAPGHAPRFPRHVGQGADPHDAGAGHRAGVLPGRQRPLRGRDRRRARPRAPAVVCRRQSTWHRDPGPTAVRRPDGPGGVGTRWRPGRLRVQAPRMTDAIDTLLTRAQREIDAGLLPSCQIALARNGELEVFEAYGDATTDTRYVVFSATKAFVASLVWVLIGEGLIDVRKRVVDYIPEFAPNGKDGITVEQVMLHTSGFPYAPMPLADATTRERRVARMAGWRLNWEPDSTYEYHAESAHWVLVEIIDRVTGGDYRDLLEERVTRPAGIDHRVLGVTDPLAPVAEVGEEATPDELEAVLGVRDLPITTVTPEGLIAISRPEATPIGHPGGGGVMT